MGSLPIFLFFWYSGRRPNNLNIVLQNWLPLYSLVHTVMPRMRVVVSPCDLIEYLVSWRLKSSMPKRVIETNSSVVCCLSSVVWSLMMRLLIFFLFLGKAGAGELWCAKGLAIQGMNKRPLCLLLQPYIVFCFFTWYFFLFSLLFSTFVHCFLLRYIVRLNVRSSYLGANVR